MESIWDWFRALNDARGINLTILYDAFDRGRFVGGLPDDREARGDLHRC